MSNNFRSLWPCRLCLDRISPPSDNHTSGGSTSEPWLLPTFYRHRSNSRRNGLAQLLTPHHSPSLGEVRARIWRQSDAEGTVCWLTPHDLLSLHPRWSLTKKIIYRHAHRSFSQLGSPLPRLVQIVSNGQKEKQPGQKATPQVQHSDQVQSLHGDRHQSAFLD